MKLIWKMNMGLLKLWFNSVIHRLAIEYDNTYTITDYNYVNNNYLKAFVYR